MAPSTDWRQKLDHGCQGLGSWSTFMTLSGKYRHPHYSDCPFFHPNDAIRHNRDISGAWTLFIPDTSEGFTQAVVERLDSDMCGLSWERKLGHIQTFSNPGRGSTLKNNLWAIIEDAIASPVDIPSSIARYQKTLQYASTPLDYVFWIGLYLALSNIALHPGNVPGLKQRNRDRWI